MGKAPPLEFSGGSNLFWEAAVGAGNSSPIVSGGRVFLTSYEGQKLRTSAWELETGRALWTAEVQPDSIEPAHRLASPAVPTAVTDGRRVVVDFGSYGLVAYDPNGAKLWERRLPKPVVEFGASSSPLLLEGRVYLNCDQDLGSYLTALDAATGRELWRVERAEFRRGFATPFLWESSPKQWELVVPGSLRLVSYDAGSGRELWTVRGTSRVACSSPTSGEGLLFTASWNVGGDAGSRIEMPTWEAFAPQNDANHDGLLSASEIPVGPVRERFTQMDLNKDGQVTPVEWNEMAVMFAKAENALLAIRPGGRGDITQTHVAWKATRSLPYVASPLYYEGRLYTVRSGGMATAYEASTGRVLYQDERLGALGDYYASPVAVAGRVYFVSQAGRVTVLRAGDRFEVLSRSDLGDEVTATPALSDGRFLVRLSGGKLKVFGEKRP